MTFKLTKYVDALKQGEKEKADNLAPARAAQQQGELGLRIASLRLEIQSQENAIAELSGKFPLPVDALLDAGDELDLAKRQLVQLEELSAQLFG
jgi:hypothetical protein